MTLTLVDLAMALMLAFAAGFVAGFGLVAAMAWRGKF